jgi:hypothetical protein
MKKLELLPAGREITSLVATANLYHGRAHILLPKLWDVVAVIDSERSTSLKIAHVAKRFGNGAHLVLPAEWVGQRIFCNREKGD